MELKESVLKHSTIKGQTIGSIVEKNNSIVIDFKSVAGTVDAKGICVGHDRALPRTLCRAVSRVQLPSNLMAKSPITTKINLMPMSISGEMSRYVAYLTLGLKMGFKLGIPNDEERRLRVKTLFLYLAFFFNPITVFALGYPSALPNNHLGSEIQDEKDRKIPKGDWFSAAVDGHSYLRTLGRKDFYHGIGYWIQARTEFRPHDSFHLNVRSIFYSGSFSGGYTEPTGYYHLFGLYGLWPEPVAGGKFEGRAMDIERQTIGQGLMIEEREMAGVWFKWSRDDHYIRLLGEGTGGLLLSDDLANLEFQTFGGFFGAGVISWTASDQSNLPKNRAPLYYVTSSHGIGHGVGYFAEVGSRHSKYAGLFGFKSENEFGWLKLKSRIQGRYYDDNFGDEFVGAIQQMYVSYDQYDKRFTNVANVFVTDDNVYVYSLVFDLDYEFSQNWVAQARNEVGQFDYKQADDKKFYFYRVGVTYFLIHDRKESLTIFASNKVLMDSYSRPPSNYSLTNLPLFYEANFVGFEATFRF